MSQKIIREITPLSNKDCFYFADRRKTEFTYPMHNHIEYELNFCINAKGVRRIVGDSVEVIDEYDLVLITSPDLEHVWEQYHCVSKDVREITIQFSSDLFFKSFIDKNQFYSIKQMLTKAQNGIAFPIKAIMKVYPLLDTLSSEKGFYAVMKFLTILYELSLYTDEAKQLASSSFAKLKSHSESRRVQRVIDFIQNNYDKNIRLEDMAALVGLTPVSFSRFFKIRTGKTVVSYVIDVRLGYATRMLVDTVMSINEIAYHSGFSNISNFNRIFKKYKNCSPKEFRENYKKQKVLV